MLCHKTKYQKLLTSEEERKCVKQMLVNELPYKVYLPCLIVNMFLGFCAIGFQLVLMAVKGPLYFVGAGYLYSMLK